MRHRVQGRKLGLPSDQRMALLKNLVRQLFQHGHIMTTEELLSQQKASDQWAYYQAKGIKRNISSAEAAELQSLNAQASAEARKEADRYGTEQDGISKAAEDLEKQVTEHSQASEREMEHHHRFAYAVTTFQVAIALSAIAAITRRRMLWIVGLGISIVGLLCFVDGIWLMF